MNALPQYATYPKPCPKCKGRLQVINKKPSKNVGTTQQFIGCAEWPKCSHREPLTEEKAKQIEVPAMPQEII